MRVNRPLLIALIGAVVLAAAMALNYILDLDTGEKKTTETASAPTATAPGKAARESEGAKGPLPPSFDVVRVNPRGDTVIAGRAAAGAEVTILSNDEVIGKVWKCN